MSWQLRLRRATLAESTILTELRTSGWTAHEFGQTLLPMDFRDALKQYRDDYGNPCLIRWFPDIVAYRYFRSEHRMRVILFDAKSDAGLTPNFAIEIKAVETSEAFQTAFHVPCWFVWPGLFVLTPEIIREKGRIGHYVGFTSGSGTPFMLVSKIYAITLDKLI